MSWQRVRGHDGNIDAFRQALRRGRLAHAYLFTGPPGVGKRLFAIELARALLCEAPSADDPLLACGHCPACIQVEAGTHPDFVLTARPAEAHEFPIDLMREVCRGLSLKSARGGRQIVVFDEADDLNEESANCFLKTLEEPPLGAMLILLGSTPDRQLPTIVSRCQVVRFQPLPDPLVAEILKADGIADPQLLGRLVKLSRGSPGLGHALADPDLWTFRRAMIADLTKPTIDSVGLSRLWMEYIEKAGKEGPAQRARGQVAVRLLLDFLSDTLARQEAGPALRTLDEDQPALETFQRRLSSDQVLALIERCLEADAQLERRIQLVLGIEALMDSIGQLARNAG